MPVDQLVALLDEFGDQAVESVEGQGFMRLLNFLEAKAVELAPVKHGTLEGSTTTRVYRAGSKLVGLLTFNTPYASRVHELPMSARGERTKAKPGNEYGPAGPKYLERPLRGLTRLMAKDIGEALRQAWGQKAGRRRRG